MMREHMEAKHILVATLGGQPQIVTFTLDLLLRQGIPIYEVIVVHPAASPDLQGALARLQAEFVDDTYLFESRERTIHFRHRVLHHYGKIIDDIVDEPTADGTLDTIGELIRDLKREGYIVHLSISGGRRLMSFLSFSAALLYFDTPDELVHLYTPEEFKTAFERDDVLHLPADCGQRLIKVPFASAVLPVLASWLNHQPSVAIQEQQKQVKREEEQRCAQVYHALSPKRRQVLCALALAGHPSEAADLLGIQVKTLNWYATVIYRECRNAWEIPEKQEVNYQTVRRLFAGYRFPDE